MATLEPHPAMTPEALEESLRQNGRLVEHIRGLLERADARREAEPENRRKWNRVLDNLEAALSEAKLRLQHCEKCLEQEREWHAAVEEGTVPPEDLPAPCAALREIDLEVADDPGNPEAANAAKRLLDAPLEAVEGAPLEQVALAQTYLSWRREKGLANGADRRLAGRIELAIQGRNGKTARVSVTRTAQERRHQRALRDIVAKVQWNRFESLTVHDLGLALECYAVLARRPDLDESERRLKAILGRGLREAQSCLSQLCDRFERLEPIP